jgi:spermidine synthase
MSSFGGIVIHKALEQDDEFYVVDHRNLRSLYFDQGSIQSRIRKTNPAELILEYTRAMLLPLLFQHPQRVLLLGLGGGALVNYLHQYLDCTIDVVELNQTVIQLAQKYFLLPQSERVQIYHTDADQFLHNNHSKYDLILVDLFSAAGPASLLGKKAFYRRCDKRLTDQGVMAVNLWREDPDQLPDSIPFLEQALKRAVVPVELQEDHENIITLIPAKAMPFSVQVPGLGQAAKKLKQQSGLNLAPFIPQLLKYL